MKRRHLIAATAAGGIAAVLAGKSALADNDNSAAAAVVAATDDTTIEPLYGAGLYDVDPDQGNVSQSPDDVVTGDVDVMPDDWSY